MHAHVCVCVDARDTDGAQAAELDKELNKDAAPILCVCVVSRRSEKEVTL